VVTCAGCLRILYVEDHADTLTVVCKLLRREGHTVVGAGSYAAAQEVAKGERFDLLVTDVGLCDGDGLALLAEMRQHYAIPGIVISGYGEPADVAHSTEAGFAVHLTKPIEFATLTQAIDDVVSPHHARESLAAARGGA
jgi:CheY-like chemotaxis protein